jgi:hypothetical protein
VSVCTCKERGVQSSMNGLGGKASRHFPLKIPGDWDVWGSVCKSVWMCTHACMCMYVCAVCMCMYVCMCVHVHTCVCMCMYVHVCIRACVHVRNGD